MLCGYFTVNGCINGEYLRPPSDADLMDRAMRKPQLPSEVRQLLILGWEPQCLARTAGYMTGPLDRREVFTRKGCDRSRR